MKRTLKYALTAVLASAFAIPAMAQDNFPDTPDNHWAYEALGKLKKDGLLVGYPDGLYRGGRPASRYELAVAIHAVYLKMKDVTDGLDSQIKALSDKAGQGGNADEVKNLRDALTALQADVAAMKGYGDDMANLKKLADTFQKELQSLGVDVEAMKKDIGDLKDRVSALEKKKPAITISGDVNLFVINGGSQDDKVGLDMDGRIYGVDANGHTAGLTRDFSILHEGAFTFTGTNDTGPKYKGTIVVGNMLGDGANTAFGTQAGGPQGFKYSEPSSDIYIQDLSVKFDSSVAGTGFNAEIGRVSYKVSPYIFQRPDYTSYFSNTRWDNGKYLFDGAIVGLNLGGAKVEVFGGRNSSRFSNNKVEIQPTLGGPLGGQFSAATRFQVDRSIGANITLPIMTNGNLNVAYLLLASNTGYVGATGPGRMTVYGGNVDFKFSPLGVEGGYSKSEVKSGNDTVSNSDNSSYYGKLTYGGERWGLFGGYRVIEGNFVAPGDWGRLGIVRNPSNIEGFNVGGHINIGENLTVKASGEFDKGHKDAFGLTSGFDKGTKINKYEVGVDYKLNPSLNLMLGYEWTEFKSLNLTGITGLAANDTPKYAWTTIGLGYGLSETSKLMISYQLSDIDHEFQLTPTAAGQKYKGGLLTTQLSLKF